MLNLSDNAPFGGQWRGHPGGKPGPQDVTCAGETVKASNPQTTG